MMNTAIGEILSEGRAVAQHRPWPRTIISGNAWATMTTALVDGRLTLLGLWGETSAIHAAVIAPETNEICVASLDCPDGRYPSIGKTHAPAIRLERAAKDLFGLTPTDARDTRPWLDHGRWKRATEQLSAPPAYAFLTAVGD